MKRPIGALALAILTFLQGLYQVYVVLNWLDEIKAKLPKKIP